MTHKFIIREQKQRDLAKAAIDAAPVGYVVTIEEQKRSGEANSKLWAMLGDVSRSKPQGREHTPEVWKELMMHACGHATQFEMGLNGQPFPTGFRSSKMTKSQFSDLLEFVASWGAENGVKWSDDYSSESTTVDIPEPEKPVLSDRQCCINGMLYAATVADIGGLDRRVVIADVKDQWKKAMPNDLDFVRECLTVADKVAKGTMTEADARKHLEEKL